MELGQQIYGSSEGTRYLVYMKAFKSKCYDGRRDQRLITVRHHDRNNPTLQINKTYLELYLSHWTTFVVVHYACIYLLRTNEPKMCYIPTFDSVKVTVMLVHKVCLL